MNVGLGIKRDATIDLYGKMLNELNMTIKRFFVDKNYGDDLENLSIGLIIMGEGSERLHPVSPFTYEKESFYKDIFTNKRVSIKNAASYGIKSDYELFIQMSLDEAERYLSKLLIESTKILERHQDQFPNFNVKQFRKDFSNCLGSVGT